jgi:SAM-dependent methyltransferase
LHNNSLILFRDYGLRYIKQTDSVLEVGPDWAIPRGRVRPLLIDLGASYYFTDIEPRDSDQHDYIPMNDEYSIDAEDGRFDAVVTLNVIEHVPHIWKWTRELVRVVKPGGILVFVNPLSWPYHPSPQDCWRILPDGYKALFEECGIEHEFSMSGNVVPLEGYLRPEHGPHLVTDTVAVGRKPTR